MSGKVSEELAENSALAIALAMLGIAIYIWFRFEWQFGVGALLTLAHDVAMTLGFFAFTRLQVDLNVVAAFLTIVGYSLNDTVVIYDRIRENLRKYRKMAILPLLNLSLNETLARTVVTSLTVLIALGVLMLIGPEVIFGLAIAIFLGVLIGTYSSIYISAPVLVWLGVKPDSFLKGDEKDEAPRRSRPDPFSERQASSVHAPCLASSGAHANEVPMLKISRSAALLARLRAASFPSPAAPRQQGQGRHRLCRARRQHALRAPPSGRWTSGDYEQAAKLFDEVERQHPYSVWARRAQLMSAFNYYLAQKYPDAISSAQRFLTIHPGNTRSALRAISDRDELLSADRRRDPRPDDHPAGVGCVRRADPPLSGHAATPPTRG